MTRVASNSTLVGRLEGNDRRSLGRSGAAVRSTIEAAMIDGTPAMRVRGRRLLARWPRDAAESCAVNRVGVQETSCA